MNSLTTVATKTTFPANPLGGDHRSDTLGLALGETWVTADPFTPPQATPLARPGAPLVSQMPFGYQLHINGTVVVSDGRDFLAYFS